MAPVPPSLDIPDLVYSSLELDSRSSTPLDLPSYLSGLSLKEREALTRVPEYQHLPKRNDGSLPILSPADTFKTLTGRDVKTTQSSNPGAGSINPSDINMKGVQAAIALIGAAFVLGAIWFFFWAKNGGFKWRKGDWEEYKSTVLRRKGPNGTTLSNATKSTRLGGGSVVGQGYSDADGTVTETMTELSSEAPIIKEKRSPEKGSRGETAKERKIREAKQAGWEGGHDDDVRAYRHEKPARVGGLNKDSDAQFYGTDYTETDVSDLNSSRPSHHGHRQSSWQAGQDKRQSRRDFSYGTEDGFRSQQPQAPPQPQQAPKPTRYHSPGKNPPPPQRSSRSVPGSYTEPMDFSDLQSQNTKSYHHPIPGLSGQGKPTGGYRRDRRDSLDD